MKFTEGCFCVTHGEGETPSRQAARRRRYKLQATRNP